jgi:hypothetical protein
MKVINWITILTFLTVSANSQVTYKKLDTKKIKINLNPNSAALDYSPSSIIRKIAFLQKRLDSGYQGIEFIFITKKPDTPIIIKLDSIVLKSTNNKTILINHPLKIQFII